MFYLVAYDITEDKRLRKVADLIEEYGERVQRSVFECNLRDGELSTLLFRLRRIMNRREDRVTVYLLCEACRERFKRSDEHDPDVYVC